MDCKVTENYFKEKARMCEGKNCSDCPLGLHLNSLLINCVELQNDYPQDAIAIVQKWSDEHPQKTYKDYFFEKFPNACKTDSGLPEGCRRRLYGTTKGCCGSCTDCWNEVMSNDD